MARIEVSYEVHVMQKGRWEIQARYPDRKEAAAVEDAVVLDRTQGIDGVRVIKEAYDPDEGTSDETVIYLSPKLKDRSQDKGPSEPAPAPSAAPSVRPAPAKATRPSKSQAERSESIGQFDSSRKPATAAEPVKAGKDKPKKGKKQKKSSFLAVVVKILLVILVSISIAGLIAVLSSIGLRDTSLAANAQTNIVVVIFIIVFLLSSGFLGYTFLSKETLEGTSRRAKPSMAAAAATAAAAKKSAAKKAKEKTAKKSKAVDMTAKSFTPSDEEDRADKTTAADKAEEAPEKEAAKAEEKKAEEEKPEETKPEEDEDEEEEEKEEEEETAASLSPEAEKHKVAMMKFLGQGLEKAQEGQNKLDSFNKFGINLFLAGGCEMLSQEREVDPDSISAILSDGVQVMGFKKSDADAFAGKYQDYLMADSRYMQMFQAGRNAMSTYLGDEAAAAEHMENALKEWNKPKDKEEKTGPVTVLFTDMVGSTALTQTKGDAVAQQVVRAHNRIVRDALTEFVGREIKHTGDGIMASFATTSMSVEASISIQKKVEAHNQAKPDLPLHLKIGINAGEPISEDDDLFGTTVQLAARIVDKAQSEQIFVSEIVRGICAGKETKFKNLGHFEMKGFADPITLYEVIWDGSSAGEDG